MQPARHRVLAVIAAAVLLAGCSDDDPETRPNETITASPTADTSAPQSTAPADPVTSESPSDAPGPPTVVGTIATGLVSPWGLAFLPNGDAVVTERDTTRVLLLRKPSYDVMAVGRIESAVGL